jgi:hypothetical protein
MNWRVKLVREYGYLIYRATLRMSIIRTEVQRCVEQEKAALTSILFYAHIGA